MTPARPSWRARRARNGFLTRWQQFVVWLATAFRSRYVLWLEVEVERLRAENRALVNSLLGTAGIPPLEISEAKQKPPEIPRVRRRSWHQMMLLREAEAARARHRNE